jgi:hypothetical protein
MPTFLLKTTRIIFADVAGRGATNWEKDMFEHANVQTQENKME